MMRDFFHSLAVKLLRRTYGSKREFENVLADALRRVDAEAAALAANELAALKRELAGWRSAFPGYQVDTPFGPKRLTAPKQFGNLTASNCPHCGGGDFMTNEDDVEVCSYCKAPVEIIRSMELVVQ